MSRYNALSDGLVGLVLPRAPASRHSGGAGVAAPFQATVAPYDTVIRTAASPRDEYRAAGDATDALLALTEDRSDAEKTPMCRMTSTETPSSSGKTKDFHKHKRADDVQSRRREQCRANQARYRDKQRNAQQELEKNVELLHQEVTNLKWRYRALSSRERNSQSPWSIVAEVFHLLESSFRSPWRATMERAFAHDAAMGDLRGVDALMEQLRLYSQCFDDPRLQLKRIESVAAGVMTAHVKLSVTVTEFTLKRIFPHLGGQHGGYNSNGLYERLLGQRLEFTAESRVQGNFPK
ncbi:hypothetical protein PF008_g18629 [Phytophthora fragariae]|uniref:BZIP domain-containing protein n=1 Tax=Phytophthora fragariae TaxID=53985 RepID=A0A6G0R5V6_9STRA|nr:hypothetical protein PF008_g18629 [Phytophthora fragariae]